MTATDSATGLRLLLIVLGFWLIMRSINKDQSGRTLIDYVLGNQQSRDPYLTQTVSPAAGGGGGGGGGAGGGGTSGSGSGFSGSGSSTPGAPGSPGSSSSGSGFSGSGSGSISTPHAITMLHGLAAQNHFQTPGVQVKQRLFANPANPTSFGAGGEQQLFNEAAPIINRVIHSHF